MPLRVAKGLERQKAGGKPLPVKTQEKYRRGIGKYERRWSGELWSARALNQKSRFGVPIPMLFSTRARAEEWLEEQGIVTTETYITYRQRSTGRWMVYRLR